MKRCALLLLCLWPFLSAQADAPKIRPWMMADWESPAPRFADLGVTPREMAVAMGKRLVIVPHAPRDIAIPSEHGLKRFSQARFISAVARVDLPAETLRRRLQDFSSYRNMFPLLPQSEVLKIDGPNVLTRYRIEVPLPAFATFTVDFRIKNYLEQDGSISFLLVDGKAESLVAMIGGMTDELADQPVLGRWEALPIDSGHALLVFTYWDRIELKSFFARRVMDAYPELKVAGPYLMAMGAAAPLHRIFSSPQLTAAADPPQSMAALSRLQPLAARWSRHGHVAVIEPEQYLTEKKKPPPLRYVSVMTAIRAPVESTRLLCTNYPRLPEALREMRLHDMKTSADGKQVDLDISMKVAVLVVRFSVDMNMRNEWVLPHRLEFRQTKGDLAQVWGAAEWSALPDSNDTQMFISIGYEVGENAPMLVRLAHNLIDRLPYIDQMGALLVQLVAMERLKPWVESQTAKQLTATR